jgi:hypothetical protein
MKETNKQRSDKLNKGNSQDNVEPVEAVEAVEPVEAVEAVEPVEAVEAVSLKNDDSIENKTEQPVILTLVSESSGMASPASPASPSAPAGPEGPSCTGPSVIKKTKEEILKEHIKDLWDDLYASIDDVIKIKTGISFKALLISTVITTLFIIIFI